MNTIQGLNNLNTKLKINNCLILREKAKENFLKVANNKESTKEEIEKSYQKYMDANNTFKEIYRKAYDNEKVA